MKHHKFFMLGFLCLLGFCGMGNIAYGQVFESKAYPSGNYIFCGKEIPKDFSFLIERQEVGGKWVELAVLQAPESLEECSVRLFSLPPVIAAVTNVNPRETEYVWNLLAGPADCLDSLYGYAYKPCYQYVAGTAWFDDGITRAGTYHYRISRLDKTGKAGDVREISLSFPPKPISLEITPVNFCLNPSSIEIQYEVSDIFDLSDLKILRSPYKRNDYKEIAPILSMKSYKGGMVVSVMDPSPVKGMTYSYVAIPYDGLGNKGKDTEALNVYFVSKGADLGLILDFHVVSEPENKGNRLTWEYRADTYVNMIEIFRSPTYEGNYTKIASVAPGENSYFDATDIDPARSYFYFITLHDGLGNSLPSARFPAVLEGREANSIAPQDLRLTREGNVVTLTFRPIGTRLQAYYVYRADGYEAPLHALPRMLFSTDAEPVYRDTLPLSRTPAVYSYAVASVNTSSAISPLSHRVNTAYSGGLLPIPRKLDGFWKDNKVRLMWSDVSEENPFITAYQIFRQDSTDGPSHCIGTSPADVNSFVDTLVSYGRDYVYTVRCMSADSTDVGAFSLPFGLYIPKDALLPPSDLFALASDGKVLLQWVLPQSPGLEEILIYRADDQGPLAMLKKLPAHAEAYEDTDVREGQYYYYVVYARYKQGISPRSDMVSAKP